MGNPSNASFKCSFSSSDNNSIYSPQPHEQIAVRPVPLTLLPPELWRTKVLKVIMTYTL